MNVLFLDIDGVLNSHRTAVGLGGIPWCSDLRTRPERMQLLDPVAVGLLRAACAAADLKIVLSSTWRKDAEWTSLGAALDLPIIDRTPTMLGIRGSEIAAWLDEHPEVESYAIVDDDSDMLPEQMHRFVKTNGAHGYGWEEHIKLCDLFGVGYFNQANRGRPLSPAKALDWSGATP